MNSSTVVTVKKAMVTTLQARAGLAGIQVSYAHPGDKLEPDSIWMGDVRGHHEIAALRAGRKVRNEEYTLDVIVSVLKAGGDVQDAEDRAFVLFIEVEGALADDPRLGGTVLEWAKAGEFTTTVGMTETGGLAEIKLGVECRARLT